MDVFSSNGSGVVAWGPVASVNVKLSALQDLIDDSWILISFEFEAKEMTDVRQCFNEVSYIYALGNDQSQSRMTMTFAIFIGAKECKGDNNMTAIGSGFSNYLDNRISKKQKTSIAIGSFSGSGWVTGLSIGNVDARRGLCYGTVDMIVDLS